MEAPDYLRTLRLDGGHLALDFVNTLGGLHDLGPQPHDEHLRSYRDLLVWSVRVGTLSEQGARRLERVAATHPRRAAAALAEALSLRELIYAVVRPLSEGRSAPRAALEALAAAERAALEGAELRATGGSYRWVWPEAENLRRPLWPLPHAAVELLDEGPLERLKVCGRCRWMFLDRSKNRSRRWCSMKDCGTSEKIIRHSERRRRARARLTNS